MQGKKPVWESKTIMACVSALAAALMAITGHYTGTDPLPDQALYSAFISAVASVLGVVFRVRAEHTLSMGRDSSDDDAPEPSQATAPDPIENEDNATKNAEVSSDEQSD